MSSALEKAIRKNTLKKVNQTCDRSAPKLKGYISETEIQKIDTKILAFNFENWYDALGEHTFPSAICPISVDLMQLFVDAYPKIVEWLAAKSRKSANWEELQEVLSSEQQVLLQSTAIELQGVMNSQRNGSDGVFVKSSSRSPKDAPVLLQGFTKLYLSRLANCGANPSFNDKLLCMMHAASYSLKMQNAYQVLVSFLLSERIYEDIKLALEYMGSVNEHFIVRKFVELDCELEFRGFVYGGTLNALSQYNHFVVSHRLLEWKEEYSARIVDFFNENLKDGLTEKGFINYIIDFAITPQRIWVIELNPWLDTCESSACLFNWTRDSKTLKNGPFEFRVRTKIDEANKVHMDTAWRQLLNISLN